MNRLSDLKRMILLLLAGILSACSHDDLTETRPAENGEPLVLTAVMADATSGTRATPDNSWEGTETVIVEVIDNYDDTTNPDWTQAKKGIYTAGTDGKLTFTSGEQSSWLSDTETKLVRAWHYGDDSEERSDSWSVQTNQTDDNYANSDLLFAQGKVSGGQEIALKFYHQVAKVVVHVRNVGPVYGSNDVSVTIGEMNNIVMNGRVSTDNISENYLNWTPGSTMGTITAYNLGPKPLASDENETSLASFAALVIPQTVKEKEYYLVINNRREYSCYASKDIVWKAGHSYTYEVTITKESGVLVENITVSDWGNGGNYDLTTTE
ncbi:fimbrillin family protein [Bacteroides caecigallinarum]|uniref:fimbrillin family protein n=1 Tax=Bacteroides caecigallinarum TaxID=1411144 RepID=UPI001F15921E|nr:fimbrillin family protein [Bacteroides caecigallinarum]MCF2738819.1 fimbrillin family protein [Bacteroides caecigallinarum]